MARGSRRGAREAAALEALKRGDGAGRRPPGVERAEDGWVVRSLSASASGRSYRCPGCDQELTAAAAHVVVWPDTTRAGR